MKCSRVFIALIALAISLGLPQASSAADFDWNSIGWTNGQTSAQTFNDVDGSGVNVTVTTFGNTGTFTNGTPALYSVGGNNELRLFPNFSNTSQSVTTRLVFSQPVSIEGLIIKDIDSDGYSDGVRIEGFSGGVGGSSLAPTTVTPGSAVTQTSATEFDADQNGRQWAYTDARGWVTTAFSGSTLVDVVEITHFSGVWAPSNPSGQAITISDFEFFTGFDSSDAPASYGQATHDFSGSTGPYLGTIAPDAESIDLASGNADGDDTTGSNDEDGVTFTASGDGTQTITANITVANPSGDNLRVCGWFDLPDSGTVGAFERGEGQCTGSTGGVVQFSWSGLPADQSYTTYARFRVTSQAMGRNRFVGSRNDGEVEDYELSFDFTPTAVTIGDVALAAVPVTSVLSGMQIDSFDRDGLEALNLGWQPDLAYLLAGADEETQLQALQDYLDPDGDGTVAMMRWATLEERGTIGFYVERRSAGTPWQRINAQLLPGLITAPMGGEYQLADPGARPGVSYEYRLIELEARGSRRHYGPFELRLD